MKTLIIALLSFISVGPSLAASASTDAYIRGAKQMHRDMAITYSGHVETDFVRGMVPHHQGAIDMSDVVLQYGKDDNIRSLAEWIRMSQELEIDFMNRWLNRRGLPEPASQSAQISTMPAVVQFNHDMATMHHNMNIAYSDNADLDFVCGMIPHHQGAIDMAVVAITHAADPEILPLARGIIRSQSSDIARMQRWLSANNHHCALAQTAPHHQH